MTEVEFILEPVITVFPKYSEKLDEAILGSVWTEHILPKKNRI